MAKRVFIIHGWGGFPTEGWFPWLKKELEKKGFKARILKMPNPRNPRIEKWVKSISMAAGKPDEETFFVGHSIGCQAILRYLQKINKKTGGAVLVGGWFKLTKEATPSKKEGEIAKPWLQTKINFDKIKKHCRKIVAVFSDNDPYVPVENSKIFRKELNAKIIIEKNKKHFSGEDGIKKLPAALKELLRMSR